MATTDGKVQIKFTRGRPSRSITVTLGVASERPELLVGQKLGWDDIIFTDHRTISQDILENPEWGRGQKLYLWIKVTDSGIGLAPNEQGQLFTRFTQANSRTHIKYGGSGLGLFISK